MNSKLEGMVFPKIHYVERKDSNKPTIIRCYLTYIRKKYNGRWYLICIRVEDECIDMKTSINSFLDIVYRTVLFYNIEGMLEINKRDEKLNNGRILIELDEYQGSEEERLKIN
jgi:hypothetical protein